MKLAIYVAGCGIVLAACSSANSSSTVKPSIIYEQYNEKVIRGISYEEEKSYYTESRQADMEQKIPQYMQQMKKSREQVIQMYQQVFQSAARCKKNHLSQERIKATMIHQVMLI